MTASLSKEKNFSASPLARWAVLLAASLLLHLFAVEWAGGHVGLASVRGPDQTVLVAQLHAAPAAIPPAPATSSVSSKPPAKRVIQSKSKPNVRAKQQAHIPAQEMAPVESPIVDSAPELPDESSAADHAMPDIPSVQIAAAQAQATHKEEVNAEKAEKPASGDTPDKSYRVSLLPSARLDYEVEALRDGQKMYGRGKISWQSDGKHFTIDGEAGFLFFTVLSFKSSGVVDDFGISPVLYNEKRFRKSETNTHFHRERNLISFSASTLSYPRKGGEQDRASIIWQLAGIGRGDGEKFVAGEEIDFFVAGVRDAETWRIHILGEEEIDTNEGKMKAWHVVRLPRPGSYDQKIDIWLAPQQGWYPVKLRYTENSGDYLDMSLSTLEPLAK